MTSSSKNVYIDKLADIVNKYKNTYHSTIEMKPVDVKPSTYFDFNEENNKEDPKFKVGDRVRVSKYKNIFVKCTLLIGLKNFLWFKILKIQSKGHMLLIVVIMKKLLERFMRKNCKRQVKKK